MRNFAANVGKDMMLALILTTLFDGNIEQNVLELLISAYLNCLTLVQLKY